jgi:orotate phosphoribosyltransferase
MWTFTYSDIQRNVISAYILTCQGIKSQLYVDIEKVLTYPERVRE